MSNSCAPPNFTKKSFKGVENFLRKIAYNLGNTPSQTEVKIISCIPIDVSDLHQRITCLEKELECAKAGQGGKTKQITLPVTTPNAHAIRTHYYSNCNFGSPPEEDTEPKSTKTQDNKSFAGSTTPVQQTYAMTNTENVEPFCNKNIVFDRKKKQFKKKFPGQNQIVYHAQTVVNPLKSRHDKNLKCKDIVQEVKQQKSSAGRLPNASRFSSPVLRDGSSRCRNCTNKSDLCSCCYENFQNLDDHMSNHHDAILDPMLAIATEEYVNNRGNYYDSTLYDMVPVKEKTAKCKTDIDKKDDFQGLVDMLCNPEGSRIRNSPQPRQYIINYQTVAPKRSPNKQLFERKLLTKSRYGQNDFADPKSSNSSKCCYVQCGSVYAKRMQPMNFLPCKDVNISTSRSILMSSTKNNECQTVTEKTLVVEDTKRIKEHDNKTEETLNQIKTILQTVLIEVKTNAETKNQAKIILTKDAVVQKGSSQSNIIGSSNIIDSFLYSHYNSDPNPNFAPQASSNYPFYHPPSLHYPGAQCQHYPVLVPGTGKHTCHAFCKQQNTNPPQVNTPPKDKRSTETSRLIKEIYKSLALNNDNATKIDNGRKTPLIATETFDGSDIFKITKAREVKTVPAINKYVTNMSVNSRSVSKDTTKTRNPSEKVSFSTDTDRVNKFSNVISQSSYRSTSTEVETTTEKPSGITQIDERAESDSNSESECETVVTTTQVSSDQRRKEAGIFKRVISMFKGKKSKHSTSETKTEYENSGDSTDSDYETIYREPIVKPNPTIHFSYPPRHIRKSKIPSKPRIIVTRSKILQHLRNERRKRSVVDHDRLRWNEHGIYPGAYNKPMVRQPVYYQDYDAKNAFCQHNIPARGQNIPNVEMPSKSKKIGLNWLKKHKQGVCKCGEDWMKFIAES